MPVASGDAGRTASSGCAIPEWASMRRSRRWCSRRSRRLIPRPHGASAARDSGSPYAIGWLQSDGRAALAGKRSRSGVHLSFHTCAAEVIEQTLTLSPNFGRFAEPARAADRGSSAIARRVVAAMLGDMGASCTVGRFGPGCAAGLEAGARSRPTFRYPARRSDAAGFTDAFDFISAFCEGPNRLNRVVMMFSGSNQAADNAHARALGVRGRLLKPFSASELAAALDEALRSHPEEASAGA
jgi:CheY-like chemotaxis protein